MFLNFGGILLAACAPKAAPAPESKAPAPVVPAPVAPAKPDWQEEWEKTVEAAKKEGKVIIANSTASAVRVAIVEGFKKDYGISLEIISGRVAEVTAKIQSEHRAGLYNYDVALLGSTIVLNSVKPAGIIDPLEPAFILPDVTDPELINKIWWQGKLWRVDADHTHLAPALRLNY